MRTQLRNRIKTFENDEISLLEVNLSEILVFFFKTFYNRRNVDRTTGTILLLPMEPNSFFLYHGWSSQVKNKLGTLTTDGLYEIPFV